ncbi:hypothetical protein [Polymorphospora sp. NPDC050346]|uniref:hypothetical protein n=1 Tax=Polymorphospora sp. NPDC050346 TaxID=3155780 RepID=UPI0033FE8077
MSEDLCGVRGFGGHPVILPAVTPGGDHVPGRAEQHDRLHDESQKQDHRQHGERHRHGIWAGGCPES